MRKENGCLFILSYPPGSNPTIWMLYLVSREEVKQSTEARSTWEREQIRAWEETGPWQTPEGAQHERGLQRRLGGCRGPATGVAGMFGGWMPNNWFRVKEIGDGKEE